jgi:hypothetical protein
MVGVRAGRTAPRGHESCHVRRRARGKKFFSPCFKHCRLLLNQPNASIIWQALTWLVACSSSSCRCPSWPMDSGRPDERREGRLFAESDRCMARKGYRPAATSEQLLTPLSTQCAGCGQLMWVAYHTQRTITTLQGLCRLTLCVRRCRNQQCERYHRPYRPEEEGRWALPHGEFGLDVIALVGSLRYTSHRSVPEIHQTLRDRGISIAERTVTHLLQRYEELVALSLSDQRRLQELFKEQGQVILAIDGLQPDVGHEVLWVLRDCLSGEVLLARSLLSACETDLASLLREVQEMVDVPIRGVISDGQHSIEPRSPGCVAGCPAPVVPLPLPA